MNYKSTYNPRKCVTQTAFAEYVGVSKQQIGNYVKNRKLVNSIQEDGKIEVFLGSIELHKNLDRSKQRGEKANSFHDELMERDESATMKDHYSALGEKQDYEEKRKLLVNKEELKDTLYSIGLKIQRSLFSSLKSSKVLKTQKDKLAMEVEINKSLRSMNNSEFFKKVDD